MSNTSASTSTQAPDPYRLDRSTVPLRYEVTLEPDLAAATFQGRVQASFQAIDTVAQVVINAIELSIQECRIDEVEANWELDESTERLTVIPANPLTPGPHVLEIGFGGILNDKLRGFYRSTFVDDHGEERVIATTQMQATDCRRAFPCWDEPDFKAVFSVSLIVEDHLTAISNSPEISREPVGSVSGNAGAKTLVRFADTMKMSTYLVAFVVGPLEVTDPVDVGGTPVRIVHLPGKSHLTGFGMDVGTFALQWFQDYYALAYPGEKLDLLALPDFAAGAMENLGCVTFRENLLLVDPDTSTQNERQLVADVVTHELAHMWFGDLVTMRWWNGIWLNEAFATFMELAACDAYRPQWDRWTAFGVERSVAFETDALSSTRSVEYEVRSPADCEGMFDVLTYQKGGALLRMLEQYLGEDRFRDGVSHYLRTHAYGNTETNDLWDALESTSGEPVRRLMDSWIWQPGFPLISASLEGTDLVLSQTRFSYSSTTTSTRWVIPISVRNGSHTHTVLLDDENTRVILEDPSAGVIVNSGGHGFFRVAYDDALRSRLDASTLASMETLERYNLVDDAWNAVVAGRLSAADFLTLIEGFGQERDHAVWQAIVIGLRGLGRLLEDEAIAGLQRRVVDLLEPVVRDLGSPETGESDLVAKLRGLLIGTLGILGDHQPTQQRCRQIWAQPDDPESSNPELIAAATSVVAATGGPEEYESMLEGFRTASTPQEQLRNLYALAEFDHADLIDRTCELAMSGEVKTQNAPFLLRMCVANRHHGAASWAFVRERWDQANERFPSNTIVRMVDSVKLLNQPDQQALTEAFFAQHPIPQAATTLEQILERQRVNVELRTREEAALAAALG